MCCYVCWMVRIKYLLLIGISNPYGGGSGFSLSQSGPLPYVRRHINANKMLNTSLNKTFHPSGFVELGPVYEPL